MKRIIRNKVYDTERARFLGSASDCGEASLYQKRTGEYFRQEGGRILPMAAEEAAAWAREHLDPEAFGRIFAIPEEGGEKMALHVQIDAALGARLRACASAQGIPLASAVSEALEKYLG